MKCSTELIDKKHVLQAYMYNTEGSKTVLPVPHLWTAIKSGRRWFVPTVVKY